MATLSLQAAYDQARSFLETSKVEQAISVAQHILEYFPENLDAYRILGEAYLAGRQFDVAEAAFGRVLHSDPENIPAHVGLGIAYERQGKLDLAVGEFEQALEVRPDMPELRSQLLRLYTEVWGAEGATLRLSRPGLARLYAKGHMLPQAIQEFRSVIDESPDRFDARVGLAESLWRDGQTDVAAEVCEDMLAERPDVLKANLLLGYIRQASGDASGEPYWRFAQQLDPYQQVARALFEVMPDLPTSDLEIAPWDEQAWLAQRAREEQERRSREQVAAAPVVARTPAVKQEPDFFGGWDDESADLPTRQPASPVGAEANDDFLASLLALSSPINDGGGVELDASSGVTPFSFDDLSGSGSVKPPTSPVAPQPVPLSPLDDLGFSEVPDAEPVLEPFSLADLGLSAEEIALLNADVAPDVPVTADAEPVLEPFSLADLGLSAEEIALLDADVALPAADAEPVLEPFSLADLGLSAEEIALLNADDMSVAPATTDAESELTPFSLDDLGLSAGEVTLLDTGDAAGAYKADEDSQILPFSLADLGLSADEITQLNAAAELASPQAQPEPFSFDESFDFSTDEDESPPPPAAATPAAPVRSSDMTDLSLFDWTASGESTIPEGVDFSGDNSDLQPFSLDDLDLNAVDDYGMVGAGTLPPSLQPFSLDDQQSLPRPREMPMPALDSDDKSETGGYSWQQPVAKPRTDFLHAEASAEPTGGSIFLKLKQRASELPKEELPPLPPMSVDDEGVPGYFSSDADDVLLRDDDKSPERFTGSFRLPKEGAPPAAPVAPPAPMEDADLELTPFSLEELGLTPEEIALLGGGAAAPPASMEDADLELTPFSLEELGLSPEEIALLGGAASAPAAAPPTPTPVEEVEPDLTPFSLEELGLSPEEIALLGGAASAPPAAPPTPTPVEEAEPELTPFSLEELGLTPEEIALLGGGTPTPIVATGETIVPGWSQGEELELTPFSMEDLGLSSDTSTSSDSSGTHVFQPEETLDSDVFDFDLDDTSVTSDSSSTDMLGHEVEPFSFDDFDSGPASSAASAESSANDDAVSGVEPFSFDDMGMGDVDTPSPSGRSNRELSLTDDELAGLDLGEFESLIGGSGQSSSSASKPESEVATGDRALDRLINLGQRQGFVDLTDIISVVDNPEDEAERIEEIGWTLHRAGIEIRDGDEVIDMEESEADADEGERERAEFSSPAENAFAESNDVSDAEPDMTPFSLEDLGLSPEEIAALGLSENAPQAVSPPAPAPPPPAPVADAEPELVPFSLAELGLSPEEIAMLSGTVEPSAPPPPAPPAPVVDAEPELVPFSLEELGLSPEEIALLSGTAEPPAPPAKTAPPAEPELVPFSLEDLGLSPEEIASLGLSEDVSTSAANAPADDIFSFDVVEERPVEKAVRTAPRVVEPPPPPPTQDTGFIPEPLDSLDTVWDVPMPDAPAPVASAPVALPPVTPVAREKPAPSAREKSDTSARVVIPPSSEREKPSRAERREPPPRPRDDDRPARREPSPPRPRDDDRPARREPLPRPHEDLYARREVADRSRDDRYSRRDYGRPTPPSRVVARQSFSSFVPTGDDSLDEYLVQMETELDNYGMALSLARLSAQTGRVDLMVYTYKQMIRGSHALDAIIEDVPGLIESVDDQAVEQQLYRVLGDALAKQGRLRDAMAAYNHTFFGS